MTSRRHVSRRQDSFVSTVSCFNFKSLDVDRHFYDCALNDLDPADLFSLALLLHLIWTCSWRTEIDLNGNTPSARLLSQALSTSLSVSTRRPLAQGSIEENGR